MWLLVFETPVGKGHGVQFRLDQLWNYLLEVGSVDYSHYTLVFGTDKVEAVAVHFPELTS